MFEYSLWKLIVLLIIIALAVWFAVQVFEAPMDRDLWEDEEDKLNQ